MGRRLINAGAALDLLQAQVDKKGYRHVYKKHSASETPCGATCLNYTLDPETGEHVPDCIMGHVYADLEVLKYVPQVLGITYVVDILYLLEIDLTPLAVHVFNVAQTAQDQGLEWGMCLALARGAAEDSIRSDTAPFRRQPWTGIMPAQQAELLSI